MQEPAVAACDNCIVRIGTNLRSGHELKNLPAILSGGEASEIKQVRQIIVSELLV